VKHISPLITGTVVGGKFVADDCALFRQAFYVHEGRRVTVAVKRHQKRRSDQANRYYWGVVVAIIADYIGETDPETVHDWLKAQHNYEIKAIDGHELRVPRSTARLTTAEFEQYLERVRRWAAEFFSLYIPLPNEVADLMQV